MHDTVPEMTDRHESTKQDQGTDEDEGTEEEEEEEKDDEDEEEKDEEEEEGEHEDDEEEEKNKDTVFKTKAGSMDDKSGDDNDDGPSSVMDVDDTSGQKSTGDHTMTSMDAPLLSAPSTPRKRARPIPSQLSTRSSPRRFAFIPRPPHDPGRDLCMGLLCFPCVGQ